MEDLETNVKTLYGGEGGIVSHVGFTRVYREQVKEHGRTLEAVLETVRVCRERDILREYLSDREKEVVDIMMALFDQQKAMEQYGDEKKEEGKKEGLKEGLEEAMVNSVKSLMDTMKWTAEQAMDALKVPLDARGKYLSRL